MKVPRRRMIRTRTRMTHRRMGTSCPTRKKCPTQQREPNLRDVKGPSSTCLRKAPCQLPLLNGSSIERILGPSQIPPILGPPETTRSEILRPKAPPRQSGKGGQPSFHDPPNDSPKATPERPSDQRPPAGPHEAKLTAEQPIVPSIRDFERTTAHPVSRRHQHP